jgi:hypothetical protein
LFPQAALQASEQELLEKVIRESRSGASSNRSGMNSNN